MFTKYDAGSGGGNQKYTVDPVIDVESVIKGSRYSDGWCQWNS